MSPIPQLGVVGRELTTRDDTTADSEGEFASTDFDQELTEETLQAVRKANYYLRKKLALFYRNSLLVELYDFKCTKTCKKYF